jgi:hypothetical protein
MSLIRKLSSAMSLDKSAASSPRVHPTDDAAADAAAEAAEAGAAAPGSCGSSDAAVTVLVQGQQQQQQQTASAPPLPPHSVALVATAGDGAAAAAQDGGVDAEPPITAINKKAGLRISFADNAGSRAAGSPETPDAASKGAAGAAARKSMPPRTSLLGEWLRQPLQPPAACSPVSIRFWRAAVCDASLSYCCCLQCDAAMHAHRPSHDGEESVAGSDRKSSGVCVCVCLCVCMRAASAGMQLPSSFLLLVPPMHHRAACRLPPASIAEHRAQPSSALLATRLPCSATGCLPAVFDLLDRKKGRPQARWRARLQRVLQSGGFLLVSLLLTIMVGGRPGWVG